MLRERPPGILKFAFKVPTLIYRVGFGRMLGRRFLLLAHRGRKTGLERRVVLEVIRYRESPPAAAVLSGWAERSQWFCNLQASPPISVSIGGELWEQPECEFLEPDDVVEAIEEYRNNHRLLMSSLDRFFGWPRKASEEERRRLARELRVIEFRPAPGSDGNTASNATSGEGEPTAGGVTDAIHFGVRSRGAPESDGPSAG